jgi:flavin reductase (DIM6/NTAB) family NADH-FMN oxidoreductase RutF
VIDTGFVNRHNLFVLEVVEAWADPKQSHAKTIHHRGYGSFSVDGETIHFESWKP